MQNKGLNRFFGALALCLAAAGSAAAQDFVVTASTSPSVGPGRMLAADAPLTLAAGEVMTLLGPAGAVEIAGPFDGAVGEAAGAPVADDASPLAALVTRRERMTKLGAFRGDADDEKAEAATLFDLLADDAWCVVGDTRPELFVAPRKADRVIALTGSGGEVVEMLWPANAATRPWPADAPFRPGLNYQAAVSGVSLGAFELRADPGGATPTARVEGLINAGCLSQAEAALKAMADEG